jgi:glycosyl transferase family 25
MNQLSQYKIYLINLERSTARLAAMALKFEGMGLSFERINAVDGRALSSDERAEFVHRRPRKNGWLPGAIGCFMSHYQAWNRIATGAEEFGVVFEDDLHIAETFPALLSKVGPLLGKIDIVHLEATKHLVLLDKNESELIDATRLLRVKSEVWGAGAYILSKRVARLLLQAPESQHSPTDFFLFDRGTSEIARQLRIFQAFPALCVQSKFDPEQVKPEVIYASNIEHNSEDNKGRHMIRVIGWRMRGLRNLLSGYRRIPLADDIVRK